MERIEKNTNTNDATVLSSAITLNGTTSTTILAVNIRRIEVIFSNPSNKMVWIKEQAASVDDDKKGWALWPRTTDKTTPDNLYTGEYSAILDSGASADIYITEK